MLPATLASSKTLNYVGTYVGYLEDPGSCCSDPWVARGARQVSAETYDLRYLPAFRSNVPSFPNIFFEACIVTLSIKYHAFLRIIPV